MGLVVALEGTFALISRTLSTGPAGTAWQRFQTGTAGCRCFLALLGGLVLLLAFARAPLDID